MKPQQRILDDAGTVLATSSNTETPELVPQHIFPVPVTVLRVTDTVKTLPAGNGLAQGELDSLFLSNSVANDCPADHYQANQETAMLIGSITITIWILFLALVILDWWLQQRAWQAKLGRVGVERRQERRRKIEKLGVGKGEIRCVDILADLQLKPGQVV